MNSKKINEIFDNDKNGANLENKVAKILKEDGWDIKENQPYIDPNSDKQREIDIIATKKYLIGENNHFITSPEILEMRLFIDCKNLPNGAGLYIQEKDITSINEVFLGKKTYDNLYSDYQINNNNINFGGHQHRYFAKEKIAYKSINNDERSIGFQGANQVINAMFSSFYNSYETWNIDYPVIIVNNINLIGLEAEDGIRSFAFNNILYAIDSIPDGKNKQHFIIDIVGLDTIKGFLDNLNNELIELKDPIFKYLLNKAYNTNQEDDSDATWNSIY